jgi:hypothetical protein
MNDHTLDCDSSWTRFLTSGTCSPPVVESSELGLGPIGQRFVESVWGNTNSTKSRSSSSGKAESASDSTGTAKDETGIKATKRRSSSSGKAESASDSTGTAKYETGIKAIKATKAESAPESTFTVPTTVPPSPLAVAR